LRGNSTPDRAYNARRPRATDPRDIFGKAEAFDAHLVADACLWLDEGNVRSQIDALLDALAVAVGFETEDEDDWWSQ
jgi:hypothetical protein